MWRHKAADAAQSRPCFQPCDVASSYPKPGALHFAEPQPRVGNPAELRDGGGAVSQHEPEAHGTQNGGERGQVQLPVLHFAAGETKEEAG